MEATDDWVRYAIDKPMAAEPGKVWNYNSGASELLSYIFQKETGQDVDDYGQKYLFVPLGILHEWKRTYLGVVDTEGGLYMPDRDAVGRQDSRCMHRRKPKPFPLAHKHHL